MAKPRKVRARRRVHAATVRYPAFVIQSLDHAKAVLQAAHENELRVELWSAAGAAAYAGAGWFKAVIDLAQSANPGVDFTAVLDCADLPGLALGAFRVGIKAVCFTGAARVAAKLADIAAQDGRELRRRRPSQTLDLHHEPDPLTSCRRWLSTRRRPHDTDDRQGA
jgi:hypothetical protein